MIDQQVSLWDRLDPQAYILDNYVSLQPADLYILSASVKHYRRQGRRRRVLDVGTGAGLYSLLAALPYHDELIVVEPGAQNRVYLREQARQLDPVWMPVITTMRLLDPGLADFDFQAAFCARVTIESGSIFDLPGGCCDTAAMHYVAESITTDLAAFRAACRSLAGAVRPGGLVMSAFMERSTGYTVAGVAFPALPVTADDVRAAFAGALSVISIERLDRAADPLRRGYTGFLFLTGTAKGAAQ